MLYLWVSGEGDRTHLLSIMSFLKRANHQIADSIPDLYIPIQWACGVQIGIRAPFYLNKCRTFLSTCLLKQTVLKLIQLTLDILLTVVTGSVWWVLGFLPTKHWKVFTSYNLTVNKMSFFTNKHFNNWNWCTHLFMYMYVKNKITCWHNLCIIICYISHVKMTSLACDT